MKVSHKLALISLSFSLPIGVMLYLIVAGINTNIDFADLELLGNEYQRPLEVLLHQIPRHQQLVERKAQGLSEVQGLIEKAFDDLAAVHARSGVALQFTDEGLAKRKREHFRPETLKKEWQALRSEFATSKPEALAERHNHLIADVRSMITHVGDTSNLILDPDLDSYYLMDATLLALPQNQDRMAVLSELAQKQIGKKTLSTKERVQLSVLAALHQADIDHVEASAQTSLNEDSNFYGLSPTLQSNLPPALKAYLAAARELLALTTKVAEGESAVVDAREYQTAAERAEDASFVLWDAASRELDHLLQVRISQYRHSRALNLTLSFLALLASAALAWKITRSITGPLRSIMEMLSCSAGEVTSAVGQVAQSSQALADAASSQAAALEETTAALEEMASMTNRNAENAETAKTLGTRARAEVEKGSTDMHEMVSAMDDIKTSGDNIAHIIRAIDEIAFQTNILALNAAVEAARAGEAGHGFAVVANEVRSLAQRSAAAARETAEKIEDSIRKSERGVTYSRQVSAGLEGVLEKVRQVDELAAGIAAASKEQSIGIGQVNTAVSQIDRITQANAASAEEGAAAATELSAQVNSLKNAVDELATMVGEASMKRPKAIAAAQTGHARQEPPKRKQSLAPATSQTAGRKDF